MYLWSDNTVPSHCFTPAAVSPIATYLCMMGALKLAFECTLYNSNSRMIALDVRAIEARMWPEPWHLQSPLAEEFHTNGSRQSLKDTASWDTTSKLPLSALITVSLNRASGALQLSVTWVKLILNSRSPALVILLSLLSVEAVLISAGSLEWLTSMIMFIFYFLLFVTSLINYAFNCVLVRNPLISPIPASIIY